MYKIEITKYSELHAKNIYSIIFQFEIKMCSLVISF